MRSSSRSIRAIGLRVLTLIFFFVLSLVPFSVASAIGGSFDYSITYFAGAGTGTMSNQNGNASTVSLAGNLFISPAGEHFSFWQGSNGVAYTDSQTIPLPSNLTLTLIAQYQVDANAHTVTFNANGGSGSTPPQLGSSYQPLAANGFTNGVLNFAGWNTSADGTGTTYYDRVNYDLSLGDLTLFAVWSAAQLVTVTFQPIFSISFITRIDC